MNELKEAEIFNTELEKILSGKNLGIGLGAELKKDIRLAQQMSRLDFSADSRVRGSLKAKLLAKGEPRLTPPELLWFSVRPRFLVACATGLALFLLLPMGIQRYLAFEDDQTMSFKEGWLFRGAAGGFGHGGSPYEGGMNGLAPGSLLGGGSTDGLGAVRARQRAGGAGTLGAISGGGADRLEKISLANRGGGEVIAPLNVRDPSTLVLDGNKKAPAAAAPAAAPEAQEDFNTEGYSHIVENPFQKAVDEPLSTFSIDVDAASYANVRRHLNDSRMPPKDAVRVEEFINYFRYSYPDPEKGKPFSITTEQASCPWTPKHKLVRIGLQGKRLPMEALPANNLVFLIDSSGSMTDADKLPLLKSSFRLLVGELRAKDRIAIVAYAGAAGLVLPSTPGKDKTAILDALEKLEAGGSTAGGAGITLAYKTAAEHFLKNGNNRVILATDGDFNVGVTSDGELTRLIEEERKKGIFLTVLGFGQGNYQDSKMEKLADTGNGNYAYIDDILEARKVLVQELGATLLTIAKDVKLQIEFNPARVQAYRLIGYENRMLAAEDFNDDKKDAGELGAGHSVTALYEVIPVGVEAELPTIDLLKYQKTAPAESAAAGTDLLTVKFRYKDPDGEKSKLIERVLEDSDAAWSAASEDFQFAAAAAGFAMRLRGSAFIGDLGYGEVEKMARGSIGKDEGGYRAEFVRLIERARLLGK